jgi:hypothetical protein
MAVAQIIEVEATIAPQRMIVKFCIAIGKYETVIK